MRINRIRKRIPQIRRPSPLEGLELELADDVGTVRFSLAPDYHARLRRPDIGADEIQIEDASGVIRLTRAEAEIAGARDYLPLDAPVTASQLSGRPAYRYRTRDVELQLARDELHRLLRRSLSPEEFSALRTGLGEFPEIGPGNYDRASGQALRPVAAPVVAAAPRSLAFRLLERGLAAAFPLVAALLAPSSLRGASAR